MEWPRATYKRDAGDTGHSASAVDGILLRQDCHLGVLLLGLEIVQPVDLQGFGQCGHIYT